MNIIEKSSNGISQVSADAKLMSNRKVFIEVKSMQNLRVNL